jgi:hypothetical protein
VWGPLRARWDVSGSPGSLRYTRMRQGLLPPRVCALLLVLVAPLLLVAALLAEGQHDGRVRVVGSPGELLAALADATVLEVHVVKPFALGGSEWERGSEPVELWR